jgi:hypothetical protein
MACCRQQRPILHSKWLAADSSDPFYIQNGLLPLAATHFTFKMACCRQQRPILHSKWLAADSSDPFYIQNGLLPLAAVFLHSTFVQNLKN